MSSGTTEHFSTSGSCPSILLPTTPPSSKPTTASSPSPQRKEKPATAESLPMSSESRSPQKRTRFQFPLPSDELGRPRKKAKTLLTAASVKRSAEVEDLHSLRILQLARASREVFAAQAKYHHLRIREIDIMRMVAVGEYEEAVANLKNADRQIGEVRHDLSSNGTALSEGKLIFSPIDGISDDGEGSSSSEEISHAGHDSFGSLSASYSPFLV
ncbi:hypothetical protein V8B97DRAFT_1144880 [Scleroderma yunnanense]